MFWRNSELLIKPWRNGSKKLRTNFRPQAYYGGGEVNIVGQLPVLLKLKDKECCAIILVQKGATVDLLLGTDLLTQLGFCVLKASNRVGQMIDLLQGDAWRGRSIRKICWKRRRHTSSFRGDKSENINSLELSGSTETHSRLQKRADKATIQRLGY